MSALTILIIRHSEKPGGPWPGSGLMPDGVPDKKSLVIRGWQRAGSWSALFGAGLGGLDYPAPSVIYAADPAATTGDEPSQRPFETVIPLAARLNLTPDTSCAVGEETQLASKVVGQTGVVLVAWEHKAIVRSLLPAIANGQTLANMPTNWDGRRFDVVLRFDRNAPEAPWSFRQLCPCLLSGDSATPMG
ncbi:MAG: histidine phosphatase family protein [Verrucomicrobia bacterium]|nr:histidine phosphatase family protein [Verrucomicrobiota bacterium]